MNRYEQEQYNYIKSIARSLERTAKALEKIANRPDRRPTLGTKGPVMVKQANRVKHI
jgi:hypothetical protein